MKKLLIVSLAVALSGGLLRGQNTVNDRLANTEQEQVCPPLDPMVFPTETCPAIRAYLSPADQVGFVTEDGSFVVLSPRANGKVNVSTYTLPPKLRSEIALNGLEMTLDAIQDIAKFKPDGIFASMLPQGQSLWLKLRDLYCYYHPERRYFDFIRGDKQKCAPITEIPEGKTLDDEFSSVLVLEANYYTFLNAETAENLDLAEERHSPGQSTSQPAPTSSTVNTEMPVAAGASRAPAAHAGGGCKKNITFGVTESGHITPAVPDFADKWVRKNQDKYHGVCFSQTPVGNAENYLMIFANSESALIGFYPTIRISTATNTTPAVGNGIATDNYGGTWYFTYTGTVTTASTTTERLSVPYTDTSSTGYIYTYDRHGTLVSKHWKTLTRRNGGDPYNTLGYNVGSAFFSIHAREHLLRDAVRDLAENSR